MARITESGKRIHELKSTSVDNENYQHLGGYVFESYIGFYFYRKNQRYTEVQAGLCGENYAICMDARIVDILWEKSAEYIVIETQYKIWEISISEFIDKSRKHTSIPNLQICSEEYFVKYDKEDNLSDDKEKERKPKQGRSYKNDKSIRDKADKINEEAKENAKKEKEKEPIGERFESKEGEEEKKNYKEGEQIQLF